jgi:hypothetical protein
MIEDCPHGLSDFKNAGRLPALRGVARLTLGLLDLRPLLLRFLGFCDVRNILRTLIGLG